MTPDSTRRFLARFTACLSLISALSLPFSAGAARFDIEAERAKALDLLKQAQEINPNPWYARTENVLRRMRIIVQYRAFGTCLSVPNTAAFVDWNNGRAGDRDVYICPATITEKYRYVIRTTLIHEAVHVMGYYDECPAEKVEVSVQNDIGYDPVDSFYPHCKTPRNYRITSENIHSVANSARPVPKQRSYSQPFYAPPVFRFNGQY